MLHIRLPIKRSENSSIEEDKFLSRTVTRLMFIAALIKRYFFLFFFATINYRFRYELIYFLSTPLTNRCFSMLTTSPIKARGLGKFSTCQALYSIVRIFYDGVTSRRT